MKKICCFILALLMFTISVPVFAADVAETGEFEIKSITFDNPTPKALQTVNYTIKTKGDSSKYVHGSIFYMNDNKMGILNFYQIDSNEYKGSFTVDEYLEGDFKAISIIFLDENENETTFDPDTYSDFNWDSLDLSISSDSEGRSDKEAPILQSATVYSDNISTTGKFYVDMVVTDNIYADPFIMVGYSFDDKPDFSIAYPIGENKYRATFDADDLEANGIIKFEGIYLCDGSGNDAEYTYSGEDGAIKIDYPLDVERIKSETDSEGQSDEEAPILQSATVSSDNISTTGEFSVDMVVTDNIDADLFIMVAYSFDDMPAISIAYPIGENTYRATFNADDLEADGIIKFEGILLADGSGNHAEYTYSGEDGAIKIDYPLDVERIKGETDSKVTSDTDSTTDSDSKVITESSVKESKTDSAIAKDDNNSNDKVSNPNTGLENNMWVYTLSCVLLSTVIIIVYKKKVLKINK